MNQRAKKWLKFVLRWGIAVAGIAYVLWNVTINDRVMVLDADTHLPIHVPALNDPGDGDRQYRIVIRDESGAQTTRTVEHDDLWVRPDQKTVALRSDDGETPVALLAVKPADRHDDGSIPKALLIANADTGRGEIITPADVKGGYRVAVPYPIVEIGLARTLREADIAFLMGAIAIFPVTFLLTAYRWNELLKALDIRIGQGKTFTLNMVGAFYNSFMPGMTGGDLLKAWYVAKHTTHRTRAVMSVLIDRIIGLLALVILGGAMAALQWDIPDCRRVALLSAGLIGLVIVGLIVFYTPFLRKWTGLDFILDRLPMQRQLRKAIEAMEIYRRRPFLVLWTLIITFPVHITVIFSATLSGMAFGLPLELPYYWVVVPVVVLVGAIPISPQGAGVMEFFAIELTRRHGVTVSQAFALTMSIRLVQMLWNLTGGVFVFRGGYHAPTEKEQESLEADEAAAGAAVARQA